jgi:ABC-type bacteriocin/lantibiotic exporter with double-glycine peptidase domain
MIKTNISPAKRLSTLIQLDKPDVILILIYTLVAGLLTLVVPIGTQALVNTIAAGVFVQPLIVLSLLVLLGLLLSGFLKLLQFYLVELIQQRIFARIALDIAEKLAHIDHLALLDRYAPELVNRFFDVLTIQKNLAKLLVQWPALILQVIVGLTIMAFYSPWLLAFGVCIVLVSSIIIFGLGRDGLRSSIIESKYKYQVASWLEEIARCQVSFKIDGSTQYCVDETNKHTLGYIGARKKHFHVLLRQAIGNSIFQAFASASILGIGGWLVINKQMSLGQLVAAEIIVIGVLAALDKLVLSLEEMFDLLTGLDKIGSVLDLPLEKSYPSQIGQLPQEAVTLSFHQVGFVFPNQKKILHQLSFHVAAHERVHVIGANGSGKTTTSQLICGLIEPTSGSIEINGSDIRHFSKPQLRNIVAYVTDHNDVFEGSWLDNITAGRANIAMAEVERTLDLVQLREVVRKLPEGLQHKISSSGNNLSKGVLQRILLARAIVDNPKLLVLDDALSAVEEQTRLLILKALYDSKQAWTIIDFSLDPLSIMSSDRIFILSEGRIVEEATLKDMVQNKHSLIQTLFPVLSGWARQLGEAV